MKIFIHKLEFYCLGYRLRLLYPNAEKKGYEEAIFPAQYFLAIKWEGSLHSNKIRFLFRTSMVN